MTASSHFILRAFGPGAAADSPPPPWCLAPPPHPHTTGDSGKLEDKKTPAGRPDKQKGPKHNHPGGAECGRGPHTGRGMGVVPSTHHRGGGEIPVRDRGPEAKRGGVAPGPDRGRGGAGQGGVAAVTYTGQQPRYG